MRSKISSVIQHELLLWVLRVPIQRRCEAARTYEEEEFIWTADRSFLDFLQMRFTEISTIFRSGYCRRIKTLLRLTGPAVILCGVLLALVGPQAQLPNDFD